MKNYLICILIVIVICGGCTQNSITGDYRNEAHESQYIVFGETGTFSHYNYNNTHDLFRNGNFTVNNNILTMTYTDGQISEFYVDGNELIPIDENKSDSFDKKLENRFAKRLEM